MTRGHKDVTMTGRGRVGVITYNGIDGACAAAMGLLRFPKAEVIISSAAAIGRTLENLRQKGPAVNEIHVCGVGVYCDWEEVLRPALALRHKGTKVVWHCGRGYLDSERKQFEQFCTPAFLRAASNTDAICRSLALQAHPRADFLLRLARRDPQIAAPGPPPSEEERFWLDLTEASIAQYFKYQDKEACVAAVRKLAAKSYARSDVRTVDIFRRTGFRYALQGTSRAIRQLRQMIQKCAETKEPVLIVGESGVGKEHVAHLIHEGRSRATESFIPVNCAVFAGNPGLANSVLFGHVKGAFTGAVKEREGAFVAADHGTLFLDEIGELPVEVQAKFLRVLEDGQVVPEGADRATTTVDVRLLVATHRSLPAMIRRGEFRRDLFHRIAVLRIEVPPLRERREDIVEIAQHTVMSLAAEGKKRALTKEDAEILRSYDWPGNARQLINFLRSATCLDLSIRDAMEDERRLDVQDSGEEKGEETASLLPRNTSRVLPITEIERQYARRAWELYSRNYAATARALGIAVNTLRTWLK
jgi:DNA-binding NtrC family response regulator